MVAMRVSDRSAAARSACSAARSSSRLRVRSRRTRRATERSRGGSARPRVPRFAAISADSLRSEIAVLAADSLGGRGPGTEGERKTIRYLTNEFEALGLEPGNGDSWTQNVPLVSITPDDDMALTVTGEDGAESLAARLRSSSRRPRRWSTRSRSRIPTMVFVGYGIVAPEYGWNDYEGIDVEGKDGRHPRERSRLRDRRRLAVQRPDDDVLRPLDLQVRGGRPPGRGRRAHRPPHRTGRLSVERGRERLDGPAVRSRRSGRRAAARRGRLDQRETRPATCSPRAGPRLRRARPGGADAPTSRPCRSASPRRSTIHNTISRSESPNFLAVLPGAERPDEFVIYMGALRPLRHGPVRSRDPTRSTTGRATTPRARRA